MTYAIIGSGNLGAVLARRFARSGIAVSIANTRGPDSITRRAEEFGSAVTATSLQDALDADVVILAVPFAAFRTTAQARTQWEGKTVIDSMNFREESLAPLGGQQSSDFVAKSSLARRSSRRSTSYRRHCWQASLPTIAANA